MPISERIIEAAKDVVSSKVSNFKARNGKMVGIQDDAGEKMWIVPFDEMFELESALSAPSDAERHERAVPDGWQLVPKAMDVGMIGAWYRYKNGWHSHDEPAPRDTSDAGAWAALLAASPSPHGATVTSELDEMVSSAIEAAIESSPEFSYGWRSMPDKELIPEILDEIPIEYTEDDVAGAIYRYKLRRLTTPPPQEPVAVKALEWRRYGWVEGFAQPDGLGVWYSIQPDKPVHGPGDPPFTCNAIWGVPGQTARECLGEAFHSLDGAKAAAQADYEQRIRSALSTSQSDPAPEKVQTSNIALIQALSRLAGNRQSDGASSLVSREDREMIINGCHDLLIASKSPAPEIAVQCCMCGKTDLSTVEGDGGTECQLSDKRWTCSEDCYDRATETPMDQSLWRFWNDKARQQVTEIAALRAENKRGFVPKFKLGERVSKTKGSSWNGPVVGFYSTSMTPCGYVIESDREPGSCQLYPEAALGRAVAPEQEEAK
ncbi:hypothetical protein [Rhizobium sp. RCC_161_2]|uniref:hypothetical protein n=1 Tax=Rhizobium sp. RCC_161_2 TaxID=3239219 RepID=UPI0035256478